MRDLRISQSLALLEMTFFKGLQWKIWDYLTTLGRDSRDDLEMIGDLGFYADTGE
ncbi:MAG TPA: hypothetical protein PK661_07365 [Syntrophorhabdaceae bacterium]|jgi:4-alpha-glucanotransferase|nr:hypothetical protein [Pseudomonadota bacterium]HOS59901.1 hypothetical protein [Syntrophorhabdaceae bacterium]